MQLVSGVELKKTTLNRLNVLHNKVLRAMTYSPHKSRVSPSYKNLNLKINDIYILVIGKFMHNLHWGRIPVNFDHLFTSVNQAHSYATRATTRGGYIWQLASTVKGNRSLKHLGPKIWNSTDPSLYDISPPAFKRQLKDKLVNEYSDWLSYAILWNYVKVRTVHLGFTDLCLFVMYHWY